MQEGLPQLLQPSRCEMGQIVPDQQFALSVLQVAALGSTEKRQAAEMRHCLWVVHRQTLKHPLKRLIQA